MKQATRKNRALIWLVQLLTVLMVVGMVPILSSADASAADDWILISSGKELKDEWKGTSSDQKFKLMADIELGDKLEATSGKKTFDGNGKVIKYTGQGPFVKTTSGSISFDNIYIGACQAGTLFETTSGSLSFNKSVIIMQCSSTSNSAILRTTSEEVKIVNSTMQANFIVRSIDSGTVDLDKSIIRADYLVLAGTSGNVKVTDSKARVNALVKKVTSGNTTVTGSSICADHLVGQTTSGSVTVSHSTFSFEKEEGGVSNLLRVCTSGGINDDGTNEFGIGGCCGLVGDFNCGEPRPVPKGTLKINKQSVGSFPADSAAIFQIVSLDDENPALQAMSVQFGGSNSIPLPPGRYEVSESQPSPGVRYILGGVTADGSVIDELTIEEDEVTEVTFINYEKALFGDVTASKKWDGGPTPRPTVKFQLYRQAGDGPEEKVGTAKTVIGSSVTWSNQPNYDDDDQAYKYFVKEVKVPSFYTASESEDGLEITNTYSSPMIWVKAAKLWINGPQVKPDAYFQLWRKTMHGGAEPVDSPQKLVHPNTSMGWRVELNDPDGKLYHYWVQEVDECGNDGVPENYKKLELGLLVINTYVIPKINEFPVRKIWIDGPSPRPIVKFQLYRNGKAYGKPVKVISDSDFQLVKWNNLDETDRHGVPYEYSVREVEVPEDYEVYYPEYSREGIPYIFNIYAPKGDVTATKVWVGGPEDHPAIQLQLYRDGIPYGDPVELAGGENQYTWTDLYLTNWDSDNAPVSTYTFTVDELEVPANYKKSLDGLEVTNTYQISQIKVTATKLWQGGSDPRPDIVLQLYLGDQAIQDPVTLKSGTTTHTWEVPGTDEKGQALVYTVKEVQVPADYEVSYSEDSLTITNKYTKSLVAGDEDEPKETVKGDEDTKTPATGQGVSPYLYLGVLLVLLGLLAAVFGKRAFKKKD